MGCLRRPRRLRPSPTASPSSFLQRRAHASRARGCRPAHEGSSRRSPAQASWSGSAPNPSSACTVGNRKEIASGSAHRVAPLMPAAGRNLTTSRSSPPPDFADCSRPSRRPPSLPVTHATGPASRSRSACPQRSQGWHQEPGIMGRMRLSAGIPRPSCKRRIIVSVSGRLRASTSYTRLRLPIMGSKSATLKPC